MAFMAFMARIPALHELAALFREQRDSTEWKAVTPPATSASVLVGPGQPMYRPRDLDAYTKYGFKRNVYVYRGVMILADAIAGINWRVYKKGATGLRGNAQREAEVNDHPLADLLSNPNPDESRFDFLERAIAYWLLAGNSYLLALKPTGRDAPPQELRILLPNRVSVVPDSKGRVTKYEHQVGMQKDVYDATVVRHLKMFCPDNEYYGMPPVEVIARSVDLQQAGEDWNVSLLQHGGAPPGAIVAKNMLSGKQRMQVEQMLRDRFYGRANAGKPLILEEAIDYKVFGLGPKDMDWGTLDERTSRRIVLAYGVPGELMWPGHIITPR